MHPLEHVIYFSLFLLCWVVPVHPTVVVLTGFTRQSVRRFPTEDLIKSSVPTTRFRVVEKCSGTVCEQSAGMR